MTDALRAHCAAGRLEIGELEQRLGAALAARTMGELERLVEDLPGPRPIPTPAHEPASGKIKPGLPGLRGFRQCHDLSVERDLCFRQAIEHILPMMVAGGFEVISRIDQELLVFDRHDERVVIAFTDSATGGTRLIVQGTARRRVRKVFARLAG